MRTFSRRSGFTLIELVVVIFISSIMLALMLPLLVKARYLSQRSRCANNMRKIGLYLHDHVNSYGRFPAGVQNPRSGARASRPHNPAGSVVGRHFFHSFSA
jgi:prepilin-type N-terminal cleavage/methylation domain-containing protein